MGIPIPPLPAIIQKLLPTKIRSKLIWGVGLVHLLLMTFFVFDLVNRQRDFLRQQSLEQTESLAKALAINSSSWVLANDVAGLEEIVLAVGEYPGLHSAMVITTDGQVLAHTDASRIGQHLADEKSLSLLDAAPHIQTLHANRKTLDIAAPILSSTGEMIGWARIAQGQEKIADNLTILSRNGILYTLLAIAAGSLLAVLLGNRLTSGLHQLLAMCRQIKDGRRDLRMEISGHDEVALLEGGLNNMLDSIIANEELILLNQLRLECLANILQFQAANQQELLDHALEQTLHLTDSSLGYIFFYDEATQEFTLNSWSREAMQECAITDPKTHYHLATCGLWGETVRQRRVILVNDYQAESPMKKGYPQGHVALHNYLTIPIFHEDQIVAAVGVANKEEDYSEEDISQLTLLMNAVWKLVERMRAEEELRENRAMLRQILDTVPQSIFWKDKELRYLGCNRVFAQAVGLDDPARIKGKTDFDLPWPRKEAEAYRADDREVIDGKQEKRHIIEPLQQADGSRIWIDTTKVPLRDRDDNAYGVLGVYEDITERKQAAEVLARSEQGLKEAQRIATMGNWELDLTTNKLLWSDEIYRIFEIDPKAFGASYDAFLEAIHPDDREAVNRAYTESLTSKSPYEIMHRLRMHDGRVKYVHERGETIYDSKGRSLRSVGTVQDITEHKQAELALTQAAREWSVAMDASNDLIYFLDLNRCIVRANKAFYLATGTSPETANGRHIVEVIHPGGEAVPCPVCRAQEEKRDLQLIMEADHQDNPVGRPLEITVKIIRDQMEQPLSILMTLHDLSVSRKKMEEKANLERQLQQAQKMESVGRLAGGVAHDFNNMLGVIIGHAELALSQTDPVHPLHASLTEIHTAARRSADLTRQLLAFARKETILPKVLDLNETVEGMLKMLRRLIGEDILLSWQPATNLWPIKMDPSQIDQILANLCVNARDAIAGGGQISIKTENRVLDQAYCVKHPDCISGEYVLLAVSDTGQGMDKEMLGNIFEPFFTTKDIGKGTGLGLATVYGAVQQNKGYIDVASEGGRGTTFFIYLPRYIGQKTGEKPAEEAAAPAMQGLETILLVEDEPAILEITTMMLEGLGYTVLTANSPKEAIRLSREYAGKIHLLMTDVVMPEMNGRELTENLLSFSPHLKVLFMSGYTDDIIARHGILDEKAHFLQKPFSTKELAIRVRGALESN